MIEPYDGELQLHGKPHINIPFRKGRSQGIRSQATIFLFKLHHQTPVTRAFLQERLIANAHTLGKMLCPHVTVDDGQLLLLFCPSRCACFDSMRWINHSCTYASSCCRCAAAESRGRAEYFLPTFFHRQHRYQCTICGASYTWGRYDSAVTMTIRALWGNYEPTLPEPHRLYARQTCWVYKLHPESWGILEDDELRHVAWCDDIFCTSRWRWERLSRLLVR